MRNLNQKQTDIMIFIIKWANEMKTPIPQKAIIKNRVEAGIKPFTALNAINSLLKKGYIRRGYSEKANETKYVMIRNL